MNNVRIVFLPRDVWQGVQTMGIAPAEVGAGTDAFASRFSDQDLAAVVALQSLDTVVNALGGQGNFFCLPAAPAGNEARWNRLKSIIEPLAQSSYIRERLLGVIGGSLNDQTPPIDVVDLGPGVIGVVMGPGALAALAQDNYVLSVLTAIVQKALVYGSVEALMASPCGSFVERFVAVNAFANPNRPPRPVYR